MCVCELYVYHLCHVLTLIRRFDGLSRQWFLPGLKGLASKSLRYEHLAYFALKCTTFFILASFSPNLPLLPASPGKALVCPIAQCESAGKDCWFKLVWVLAVQLIKSIISSLLLDFFQNRFSALFLVSLKMAKVRGKTSR